MENNIKKKAITSAVWKFLERILAQSVSLIVSIIIARILCPDDYSVVSVVTIFFTFSNVIISGGLNTALIQKKDSDKYDYSTVLFVSLFLSVVVYLILFFTAPLIANLYNKQDLILICRIMGIILPINAIKAIYCAYISSNLQFKKFFFATLFGTLVSAVVGIVMAKKGFGAWALVAQQMTNTVIDTLILMLCTKVGFVLKISFDRLKSLFKYGWKILVSSLIGCLYTEITPLIIGVKYTTDDLSYYTKGRSFPSLLSTASTNTLSAVLFPVMAKYQDDKTSLLKYTRLYIRLSSFISFPLMLGFLAIADNFVLVVLTEKWMSAAIYIKIFCLSSLFDIVHIGNCETIKAMGKSGIYLIMEIIKKALYFLIIILFIFLSNTPQIMALAFICCTIVAIVVNTIPNIKLINYKVKDQLFDLLPNLFTAVIMCIAVYYLGKISINPIVVLIIQILSGFIIYLITNIIIRNTSLSYLCRMIKPIINKFLHKHTNTKNDNVDHRNIDVDNSKDHDIKEKENE